MKTEKSCVGVPTTDGDVSAGDRYPLFRSQMDVHLPAPQQSESQSFPFCSRHHGSVSPGFFFLQKSCSCQGMLHLHFILSCLPAMQYRIKAKLHHYFLEQCVFSSIVCRMYTGRSFPKTCMLEAGHEHRSKSWGKRCLHIKGTFLNLPLVCMRNVGKLLLIKD